MKTILVCLVMGAVMLATAAAADVSGKWSGSFTPESGGDSSSFAILKQSGTAVTGTAGPDESEQWPLQSGKVQGNNVSIVVKSSSDGTVYKCDLVLSGDHLKGDVAVTRTDGQTSKAKLDLAKVK